MKSLVVKLKTTEEEIALKAFSKSMNIEVQSMEIFKNEVFAKQMDKISKNGYLSEEESKVFLNKVLAK